MKKPYNSILNNEGLVKMTNENYDIMEELENYLIIDKDGEE